MTYRPSYHPLAKGHRLLRATEIACTHSHCAEKYLPDQMFHSPAINGPVCRNCYAPELQQTYMTRGKPGEHRNCGCCHVQVLTTDNFGEPTMKESPNGEMVCLPCAERLEKVSLKKKKKKKPIALNPTGVPATQLVDRVQAPGIIDRDTLPQGSCVYPSGGNECGSTAAFQLRAALRSVLVCAAHFQPAVDETVARQGIGLDLRITRAVHPTDVPYDTKHVLKDDAEVEREQQKEQEEADALAKLREAVFADDGEDEEIVL